MMKREKEKEREILYYLRKNKSEVNAIDIK